MIKSCDANNINSIKLQNNAYCTTFVTFLMTRSDFLIIIIHYCLIDVSVLPLLLWLIHICRRAPFPDYIYLVLDVSDLSTTALLSTVSSCNISLRDRDDNKSLHEMNFVHLEYETRIYYCRLGAVFFVTYCTAKLKGQGSNGLVDPPG